MKTMILFLFAILTISLNSCNNEFEEVEQEMLAKDITVISMEQQKSLDFIYNICIEVYSDQLTEYIKESPTIDDKIKLVRYCDYVIDNNGDFLIEFSEYDDIEYLLWPNGYGVF